jgi:hypothetical protein
MIVIMHIDQYIGCILQDEIPPAPFDHESIPYMKEWEQRDICVSRGMWALVDQIWTKKLAEEIGDRTCLEVMAGYGWLAKALKEHGVDIVATDDQSWVGNRHTTGKPFDFVEDLEALSAVKKYADRDILIVSWPPYENERICKVCEVWGGSKPIVYIGEGGNGCTATDTFHRNFNGDESLEMRIPQWDSLHDFLQIGTYDANALEKEIRENMTLLMDGTEPPTNATKLAEEAAYELDWQDKWLDDPDHTVWEVALEFFD